MIQNSFFSSNVDARLLPGVAFRAYIVFDEQHEMTTAKEGAESDYAGLDASGVSPQVSAHPSTEQVRSTGLKNIENVKNIV